VLVLSQLKVSNKTRESMESFSQPRSQTLREMYEERLAFKTEQAEQKRLQKIALYGVSESEEARPRTTKTTLTSRPAISSHPKQAIGRATPDKNQTKPSNIAPLRRESEATKAQPTAEAALVTMNRTKDSVESQNLPQPLQGSKSQADVEPQIRYNVTRATNQESQTAVVPKQPPLNFAGLKSANKRKRAGIYFTSL
jgi:hypothetical protein